MATVLQRTGSGAYYGKLTMSFWIKRAVLGEQGLFGRREGSATANLSTCHFSGVDQLLINFRDGGSDFMGKGVKKAIFNVNNILAPKLIGLSVFNQNAELFADKYQDEELIDFELHLTILGFSLSIVLVFRLPVEPCSHDMVNNSHPRVIL